MSLNFVLVLLELVSVVVGLDVIDKYRLKKKEILVSILLYIIYCTIV